MKKIFLLVFVVLLFVACNKSDKNDEHEIIVDTPSIDQVVTSPLNISGKAVGYWFFEGSFPVQLIDLDGKILSSGFVSAKSEWMTSDLVEFEGSLSFVTDKEAGTLIFKNDNPSGLPENEITYSVPVKFNKKDQESLVENYIRENISDLIPAEPVLGGTFYVLDIEFLPENAVKVSCEDGHIQSIFTANYLVDENQNIVLNDIVEVP